MANFASQMYWLVSKYPNVNISPHEVALIAPLSAKILVIRKFSTNFHAEKWFAMLDTTI